MYVPHMPPLDLDVEIYLQPRRSCMEYCFEGCISAYRGLPGTTAPPRRWFANGRRQPALPCLMAVVSATTGSPSHSILCVREIGIFPRARGANRTQRQPRRLKCLRPPMPGYVPLVGASGAVPSRPTAAKPTRPYTHPSVSRGPSCIWLGSACFRQLPPAACSSAL